MTKAAAYLRVSTGNQDNSNQLPDIEALARAKGYELAAYYTEKGSSWHQGHQPELARLLDDLRSGRRRYDVLLIWSIDRLCRGRIGEIFSRVGALTRLGVKVLSCKEPWLDTDGPTGDLLLAITGWVAKFESARKSERVLVGLDRARKEGKRLGRPPGSKDGKPRHRAGYLQRWAGKSLLHNARMKLKQSSGVNDVERPAGIEVKKGNNGVTLLRVNKG